LKNNKFKFLKPKSGQSLAEFAVITAMMATFIATASGKMSDMMEGGKVRKAEEELDKILVLAQNFYQETATQEGRGRFPGQDKYNMNVGGYTNELDLINDLESFLNFDSELGENWCSVFGIDHEEAPMPIGAHFVNDTIAATENCDACPESRFAGHDDWLFKFGGNPMQSPFQDGHFIYAVIAGSGTGEDAEPPILYIADAEGPKYLNKLLQF
tara:strand:- start:1787 stop:2425 length:639 start_codon:yes stop_codon:yes gene_type:complete